MANPCTLPHRSGLTRLHGAAAPVSTAVVGIVSGVLVDVDPDPVPALAPLMVLSGWPLLLSFPLAVPVSAAPLLLCSADGEEVMVVDGLIGVLGW